MSDLKTASYECLSLAKMVQAISSELDILPEQVKNTIELLDQDNTVPFIARYRKELTGKLDEERIRSIQSQITYLRNLEERKKTILKTIDEQEKLTDELREKICHSMKMQTLEDLYLPFKPKRKTRGIIAKSMGLEPLAMQIWEQKTIDGDPGQIARSYIDSDKGVATAEEAIRGAEDIVAELVSDRADARHMVREFTLRNGFMVSKAKEDKGRTDFEMYYDYCESVKQIPPHRILAMNRGEKESVLRVVIEVESDRLVKLLQNAIISEPLSIFTDSLERAVADAYDRLIAPSIEREIRKQLTERAEKHAINIFARNLRSLLLQPPIRGKKIMGIDPGYRTGCKVAIIDETGRYLEGVTIYPHPPQEDRAGAKRTLFDLANKHFIQLIAIGNGTASRETELLVAEIIKEELNDVSYLIVNEAGASVYSASPLAREEFPQLEASMRGNISIARRVLDPLAELVKIDPKSIGVGLYQHDINQKMLSESLNQVVESVVNFVGVDLNTASGALLGYVAGLNSRLAKNIIDFRDQNGSFRSREQLTQVSGMGPKAYEQCAGFLRIPDSQNLLDNTAIHPESYSLTDRLLKTLALDLSAVRIRSQLIKEKMKEQDLTVSHLAGKIEAGTPTLEDIIENLEKPGRDPRADMPKPIFRNDVLKLEDLKEGMFLKGTVRNVVDFGAFVDIGVKQDGLVHRSEMGHKVRFPLDVMSVGDIIDVRVLKIDIERGRVALSMRKE